MKYTIEQLDSMDGHEFEYAVADLLLHNGWRDVEVTKGSGDFGVDILARQGTTKYAIQCKRYSKPVNNSAVQQAASGADYWHCDLASVITNSTFTKSAETQAKASGVRLWGRGFLLKLIENYADEYDEIYAHVRPTGTPGTNNTNRTTSVNISNSSTTRICPNCGREFLSHSQNCPICNCKLVGNTTKQGKSAKLRQQNSQPPIPKKDGSPKTYQKSFSNTKQTKNILNNTKGNAPSVLGVFSLILSVSIFLSAFGFALAIIDLRKKDGKEKIFSIITLIFCSILWIFLLFAHGIN